MPQNTADKLMLAVVGYFKNLDFPVMFSYFKDVMMIVTIIFGVLFIIVIYKLRTLIKQQIVDMKTTISPPTEAVTTYDNRWNEIKSHVAEFNEAEWKMAIIEADKFTDDALKAGGFAGETMGERLILIEPGQLLSLQDLWDAHKLRNLLVHDVNYKIDHRQAVLAVEAFEKALRELGALT